MGQPRITDPNDRAMDALCAELARLAASQGRFAMDSPADDTRAAHAPMMDLVAIRSFAGRETTQDRFMPIRPSAVRSLTHYGATAL